MLQRVVDYYKRYKRPILVVGGISSFVYVTSHYAKSKFLQFQERTAKDRASKENLRRRYDQNQIDAMYTILALVQVLNDQISKEYKLEELVARISNLKSKGNSPPLVQESLGSDAKIQSMTKLQLWEELKILTFTRTLGAIYLVELLGLFGYIQMNLLGRLIYIESVSGPQSEVEFNEKNSFFFQEEDLSSQSAISVENKRLFLSFSWWFLNRGWRGIMEIIKTSVTQTVGSLSLKQKFGYDDLALLFATLRSEVDKKLFENSENFLGFLLPTDLAGEREVLLASGAISESEPESTCLNKEFRVLLDETKDFIECPDFALVRSKALDSMMELLFMDLKERLAPNPEVTTSRKLSDSTDTLPDILVGDKNDHGIAAQPLAKLLPILAQLAAPALRSNSNPYLRELAQCKEMQAFSAIVYSSFDILD